MNSVQNPFNLFGTFSLFTITISHGSRFCIYYCHHNSLHIISPQLQTIIVTMLVSACVWPILYLKILKLCCICFISKQTENTNCVIEPARKASGFSRSLCIKHRTNIESRRPCGSYRFYPQLICCNDLKIWANSYTYQRYLNSQN